MIERILFVCVGNICRSPMAEGILKARLAKSKSEGARGFSITSAGIAALVDYPATASAQTLMKKRNIDLSKHRARQISSAMVKEADVIFTMEEMQKQFILKRYPFTTGKIFLLGEEVPDPYCKTDEDYESALALIEKGIDAWQQKLCKH